MRRAVEHHLRPTTFILHVQPHDPWDEYDFLLFEAYTLLQDELCGQCGMPRYLCHNDDRNLEIEILEDDCRTKVALHAYEEADRIAGGEDYKPPVGTTLRPRYFLIEGGDPATVRDGYYEGEHQKRLALAAEEAELLPT